MSYENIKWKCLQEGVLFKDPDFPATDNSIYITRQPPDNWEWKRPYEICNRPEWISHGVSRFDVIQGKIGDCWLLAAIASLASCKHLYQRVVPPLQSFTEEYCGLFRFNFWQEGEWVEVVVDDRLPTCHGQLVFMRSSDSNEFWSALLEKAYAKLHGCYEAINRGASSEAMEDLTGGLTEKYELRDDAPPDLFTIMLKAFERSSLLGCYISPQPHQQELILPNGLVVGHAFSVTSVQVMNTKFERLEMVRIRNPWGSHIEWNGPWSDRSVEWSSTTPEERQTMGLVFQNDGEFWMSFSDFKDNFQSLEICNLGPDSMSDDDVSFRKCWVVYKESGSWVRNLSAGGCIDIKDTFWTNPQFRITIAEHDDDDDDDVTGRSTVVIALLKKKLNKGKSQDIYKLYVGYYIYKMNDPSKKLLDRDFFLRNRPVQQIDIFTNARQACGRHKLEPGTYVIVPCTFEKNQTGEFLLRIFTENKQQSSVNNELTQYARNTPRFKEGKLPSKIKENFKRIAGADMEVDADELLLILNPIFTREFSFPGFTIDACRSMIAMHDKYLSGKLGFSEFQELLAELRTWTEVFREFDEDKSGCLNSFELRCALQNAGFKLSNNTLQSIVVRYSNKRGQIEFGDFIVCAVRLKKLLNSFNAEKNEVGVFDLDWFIQMTVYS